jgi:hypothetical protein
MKILNISQVDSVFANGIYPIEMAFFYKRKLPTAKIRAALKKLSADFWPLFGEYRSGQIHFNRYQEKECVTAETFNQKIDTEEAGSTGLFEKYSRLSPVTLNYLFHLMIIQYADGTVLIPKMNHLAGDGYSYFYFLSVLAAVTRSNPLPFKKYLTRLLYKPRHRRTSLREFLFKPSGLRPPAQDAKFTIKVEQVPQEEIHQAIRDIKNQFNTTVSANDLLSAMVLKKVVWLGRELRKDYFNNSVELTIPMDVRRQITEYGPKYFGNPLLFAVTKFDTKSIQESGINEIALQIRKAVPDITNEKYLHYLQELEQLINTKQWDKLRPYDPQYGCLVTNLTKMPIDKLDFGSGKPAFIFPLTIEKNSAALLTHQKNYLLRLAY